MKLRPDMTIGQLYEPAMAMEDPVQAKAYWEALVEMRMSTGLSRQEAEYVERQNLGYLTGNYDDKTRERVARLFGVLHPFLGDGSGMTVLPPDFLRP